MIYAIAILMFAALGGFVSAFIAALVGGINLPTALLGALAAALIGWGCACAIDRREREGLAK
ncbi:hypothetical protein UFOVP653_43 [uncultured Caudovirales phage]|uniref:Uncharacterized protein n=1 Tax=uncultured Caudovirales phage TaxID=2100421 RepID=A0A6J5N8T9_9CAUD|nr:hypothetical protein UFOVP653_43 [uncultured Caudovirales phage]